MARTAAPKIVEWGTPPEPEPTGWDAIAAELRKKPGKWANVGTFSIPAARRVGRERLTDADGFETRTIPVPGDSSRQTVWARYGAEETAQKTGK